MAKHRRTSPSDSWGRWWDRATSVIRTVRNFVQPVIWFFALKDEAASMSGPMLAAFARDMKALFDLFG